MRMKKICLLVVCLLLMTYPVMAGETERSDIEDNMDWVCLFQD